MRSERTFRVAVLGATGRGNYGHGLDTSWLKVSRAQVVAVADENPAGREQAAKRLGVSDTFADCREMLDQVQPDILTIAPRWIDQHHALLLAAIERGVHVFMEKPFVRTLQEADEVVQAAQMKHVQVAIAHPTHYSPVMKIVKRLIRDGAIGDVLELRGRGKEDRRGGGEDIWVLGAHLFDMMLSLGYTPEWCWSDIRQQGEPIRPEHVQDGNEGIGPIAGDALHATYGMQHGVRASFDSVRNAGGNPSRFGLRIHGSKGLIDIVEGLINHVWILQAPDWAGRETAEQPWKPVSSAGINRPEPLQDPRYRDRNQVAMEDLLEAIEQHRSPLCDAAQGRRITEMILAPYAAAVAGGQVPLPLEQRGHPLQNWTA